MFANCDFEDLHETLAKVDVLPSLYTPVAVNLRDVCASTRGFAGEMVIETSLTVETVSVVD